MILAAPGKVMFIPSSHSRSWLSALAVLSTIATLASIQAQELVPSGEEVPSPAPVRPPFDPTKLDPSKGGGQQMLLPNAQDKFLGLQLFLGVDKVDWVQIYNDHALHLDVNSIDSEIAMSLAIGARVVDGVLALQSENVEALNESASEIEQLARRLGVGDGELVRAKEVQKAANAKEWLVVFSELGRLQVEVIRSLDTKGREETRSLVIAGGWMQAASYTTRIILDHYSGEASNFLREPGIVGELIAELDKLPVQTKSHPTLERIISALPEIRQIVNIPRDGTIPTDSVQRMHDLSSEIVKEISGL